MKKLHKAAITLPAEPRPISFSFSGYVSKQGLCSIRAICHSRMEPGSTMAGNNALWQSPVNGPIGFVDKQTRGNGGVFTNMAKSTIRLPLGSL
jgi:hypothetical protein